MLSIHQILVLTLGIHTHTNQAKQPFPQRKPSEESTECRGEGLHHQKRSREAARAGTGWLQCRGGSWAFSRVQPPCTDLQGGAEGIKTLFLCSFLSSHGQGCMPPSQRTGGPLSRGTEVRELQRGAKRAN